MIKSKNIKDYESKSDKYLLNLLNDTNIKISIPKKKLKEIEKRFQRIKA